MQVAGVMAFTYYCLNIFHRLCLKKNVNLDFIMDFDMQDFVFTVGGQDMNS